MTKHYTESLPSENLSLDRAGSTCLDALINSDTRFVLPNRLSRMERRAAAANRATVVVRERFNDRPLLLTAPGAVNWRSGGISDPLDIAACDDPLWILDSENGSALITSEIEAPRFERDFRVRAAGWDVLTAPWHDAGARLALACSYADVASSDLLSDNNSIGDNIADDLVVARLVLTEDERDELRELGALVGRALGAGIDAWKPGVSTDYDSAAAISQVLEANGAKAVCLIVGGDERLRTLRHPLAVGDVLNDSIMTVVVARRAGLHVAATRICVRHKDDEIAALMHVLGDVNDVVLEASLPGGTWGEAVEALASGYGAIGHANAWREHFQGGPIGFEQREFELAPSQDSSPFWNLGRAANTAVAWNPSLRGGAKIEETYLVNTGLEWLTPTPSWPVIEGPHGGQRSALRVLQ